MGYCTYGGKVVPGNDQAGCIGGGGTWMENEQLPTRNTQMSSLPPTSIFDRVNDTDDFGNPLNTNFEGDANFGLLRDRAINKFNTQPYESNIFGKTLSSTPSDVPSLPVPGEAIPSSERKLTPYQKATHFSEQAAPLVSQAGVAAYDVLVPEEMIGKTADFITDPVKRDE